MDFILRAVTNVINAMSAILGRWTFTRNIAEDLQLISGYIQKANMILPVDAALTVLSLWCTVQLALVAYYWITRTINLIRGAG